MNEKIRIIIADDHQIIRLGLRQIIEKDFGLQIVAEAEDGQKALALIEKTMPDIALLNIEMPKMSGFAVAKEIQAKNLPVKVIFLTVSREEKNFDEALNTGAKGYVLKDCSATDLINAVRSVAKGRHYLSPEVSEYLVNRKHRTNESISQKLTPTERRILKLIAEGKTSKEIADILFVSYSAIETHRHNICVKLNIHEQNGLLKFALLHKFEL